MRCINVRQLCKFAKTSRNPMWRFLSRNPRSSCANTDQDRYKSFRLQADLLKHWIKKLPSAEVGSWRSRIFISQYWCLRKTTNPFRPIPAATVSVRRPSSKNYIIPSGKTAWLKVSSGCSHVGKSVILLQEATALGVDARIWQHLAEAHKYNALPTKVDIFKTSKTQLGK